MKFSEKLKFDINFRIKFNFKEILKNSGKAVI